MPFRINQKTQLQYKNSLSFTNDFSVAEDGGEPVEPSEEFRYREIAETFDYIRDNNHPLDYYEIAAITIVFDLQIYPKPFLSYIAELPLELVKGIIEQDGSSVDFDDFELYRIYPRKTLQELIDDNQINIKWFLDNTEVTSQENNSSFILEESDENKELYSEVTNLENSKTLTSNTITIQSF